METIAKTELIKEVMKRDSKDELTKAEATRIVNDVFDIIKEHVAEGKHVRLTGFGTFKARKRAQRMGRNPQTGKAMTIPAKTAPAFIPGKDFKEIVNK